MYDILTYIYLNENYCILNQISLKFVTKCVMYSKLYIWVNICSGNGLLPDWYPAIAWINVG